MKFGVHVSLWTDTWTEDFMPYIEKAAALGFDSVEVPLMDPAAIDPEALRGAVEAAGVGVYCGTGLGPDTDISSPDETVRRRGLDHLKACIDIAAAVGSPSLEGVLHSAWGRRNPASVDDLKRSAGMLARAAEYAADRGLFLALECLNRYESSFFNTVSRGKEFLRMIGVDNVGLHLDTYHMNIEETSIAAAIEETGKDLFFFHLSENNRGYPGNGAIDWSAVFRSLGAIGYEGPMVIESYVKSGCPEGNDVCIWRDIEADRDRSVAESLVFLRRTAGDM